jgi:hypothetical protein
MIECKVVVVATKLVPSSLTNVIKPNFSNKNQSYATMDYLVVSFTSNIPIGQVSLKKLITKVKVSTLS